MMGTDIYVATGNGYINIPVWLFRAMYDGKDAGFNKFLFDIVLFGVASEQIAEDIKFDKKFGWEWCFRYDDDDLNSNWIKVINSYNLLDELN